MHELFFQLVRRGFIHCSNILSAVQYVSSDVIGEGTFSQVFRGYFNGSEVAIKRLKLPLEAADRNYFAEEVHIAWHSEQSPLWVKIQKLSVTWDAVGYS